MILSLVDAAPVSPSRFSRKAFDPERAMVPKLEIASSSVIPIPKSWMMNVFFASSTEMWISMGLPLSRLASVS